MKKTTSGFTIVELLIVVVVIAILAAISVVAYNGIQQRSRDSQRKQDIAVIQKALELYRIDNGGYPDCVGGTYKAGDARASCYTTDPSFGSALIPKYLNDVPKDPISVGDHRYLVRTGTKKSTDTTYSSSYDDNYVIGVAYESQGGPYATQFGATYNYVFGSNN